MTENKENKQLVLRALSKLDSIDINIVELKETLIKVSVRQDHDRERLTKTEDSLEFLAESYQSCPARKDFENRQTNKKSVSWFVGIGSFFIALIVAISGIVQIILK